MPFSVRVTKEDGKEILIPMDVGAQLFVLGANGTGKSSLMLDFYRANVETSLRISAHRQSWFSSTDVVSSPQEVRSFSTNLRSWDLNQAARWNDAVAEQRPRIAIAQLVEAENVRARKIAVAADADRMDEVRAIVKTPSAVTTINELLRLSNLPISISIKNGEQVVASKSGGPEFSIAELSDGERNALVIGATVLTSPPRKLVLIDEPERHLHRSIISPLLTQLFARRADCAFLVSTHEVMLPVDHPSSKVLLVRGCTYSAQSVSAYDADLVPSGLDVDIDNDLKKDILGARRKILFVEGVNQSLDKPLYSLVFSNVSVIAKLNCREVERAVRGIRDTNELHWVQAFGIVDGDARLQQDLGELRSKGIYAVAAYSVESVYYHLDVQRRVAEAHAKSIGGDAAKRLAEAMAQAITTIAQNAAQLCEKVAEKEIRGLLLSKLPTRRDIAARKPINLTIDVGEVVEAETAQFQRYVDDQNLAALINRYPIRETGALVEIAQRLGFQNRKQYEGAVLTLLQADNEALTFVQSLFGTLAVDMRAA